MSGLRIGPSTRPSTYQLLAHLATQEADTARLTFSEIEIIRGFPLPNNAFVDNAWWWYGDPFVNPRAENIELGMRLKAGRSTSAAVSPVAQAFQCYRSAFRRILELAGAVAYSLRAPIFTRREDRMSSRPRNGLLDRLDTALKKD